MLAEAELLATRISEGNPLGAHKLESSEQLQDLVVKREAVSVRSLKSNSKQESQEEMANRIKLNQQLMELDGHVTICLTSGIQWLECDELLIKHLCGGKFPEAGYMIYKNVRLCKEGAAEGIAAKERLTIDQIMFPKNGEMFIGGVK